MPSRHAPLLLAVLLFGGVGLTGCGAETISLPNVVGLPLDEAHRVLEKAGFKEFDDRDAFEDRAILIDANWVVVESRPAARASVAVDKTVAFKVGKRDEQRAIERLPKASPVAQEFAAEEARAQKEKAARQAEDAAQEAAAAHKRATILSGYVDAADPMLRLATNVYAEIDAVARGIRANNYGVDQPLVVDKAVDAADAAQLKVAGLVPPTGSQRAGTHQALTAAAGKWADAARTLLSADGVGRTSSLARFDQVRAQAHGAWNAALAALYRETAVAPPLLP